jgi:hypothetical protein
VTSPVECPTCGGPARDLPADPRQAVKCRWCGTAFERSTAEETLKRLHGEIRDWLRKTAGVEGAASTSSIDVATRTFLFNERILPGLRRDVRRALDEHIGDVDGAPILTPALLSYLPGFTREDALLVSKREQILGLRSLRARLEAEEVAAFATTSADRLALETLRADIDRTIIASNASYALASGIALGAELARTNLAALDGSTSAVAEVADPAAATVTRAFAVRSKALIATIDAVRVTPPDQAALDGAAARLEETAQWLLTADTRDLRGALTSTGIQRDATAARVIASIAQAIRGTTIGVVAMLDTLAPLASYLAHCTRGKDAPWVVFAWAQALAALSTGAGIPAVADTSWVNAAVGAACGNGERPARVDVVLEPFWVYSARMTKAEGFFFVSGKQYDGVVLVPAATSHEGTLLVPREHPMASHIDRALAAPSRPGLPVDSAQVGPEAGRLCARGTLRARGLKNVVLGEGQLVYFPVAFAVIVSGTGQRTISMSPLGPVPADAASAVGRAEALTRAAIGLGRGLATVSA